MNLKTLGAALGAGRSRNASVQMQRFSAFKQRIPKYRKMRKLGIRTDRLIRTGGLAGLTYGQSISGVSNSLLLGQRRAVGAATAPASGSGGQDLDVALLLADGGAKGRADPACPAHSMPIGAWAAAVWEPMLPMDVLEPMIESAKGLALKPGLLPAVVLTSRPGRHAH